MPGSDRVVVVAERICRVLLLAYAEESRNI